MITSEIKAELDKAMDHLDNALLMLSGDDKYLLFQTVYDLTYNFNPDKDTVKGKINAINTALLNLIMGYKPDPADDKSWREPEE
ncbi:hypothetical protein [Brevibacillus sp. NRS-1366]|uniref:hypothetical protein n=1 Tax=Brevibacillus sp. NRS-1366 TaxID=3233899 RepID=UPI003D1EA4A4